MPNLLVPIGSAISHVELEINCTAAVGTQPGDDPPFWGIDPSADSSNIQLQFSTRKKRLNYYGVYELPRIETPLTLTLRLLINDTAINNQTEIVCDRGGGAQSSTTVLYVFGEFSVKSVIVIGN